MRTQPSPCPLLLSLQIRLWLLLIELSWLREVKVELFTIVAQLNSLVAAYDKDGEKGYQQKLTQVTNTLEGLFEEYNSSVDKKLFALQG